MTPRFDALGLAVADMAASLAFYRLLGLDIPAGAETQPHAEATLPGGLRLMWDAAETPQPSGPGRMALAFLCDGPAGVDATYAKLTEAGVTGSKEPWDAFWGQRYATVLDPDGNQVDLFAPLPG
ncbi:VOC family protein [Streptomyces sp. NBRC 110028]|uniref:VOC family protein n=1 Tax=Streptomyces sp. NBRC 110028 TaxID=1621260 RepID=UPI0006E34FA5|nr:VOC family protein [Streptomyces sp. NBRC 110028]